MINIMLFFLFLQSIFLIAQNGWKSEAQRPYTRKGYEITEIEKDLLEIKDKTTGMITKYVDVTDRGKTPTESSPTMQVFDLINADTNLYNWKYKYHTMLLVMGALGHPLVINDLNNNAKLDLCGEYKIPQNIQPADCAIEELLSDSTFQVQKIYPDTVVFPLSITDVDNDGKKEINFKIEGGQEFYNYEAQTDTSYPDTINFMYRMWQISGAVGSETFEDMDNDQITDVIYVGDDSLPPHGQKLFIGEYNQSINNFEEKYRFTPPEWRVSGFSVGDFDNDGFKEFLTGSIFGDVYIFENTGNDSYNFIFSDTISTSNAYLTCSTNDMDNNGKKEFFIGGSSYYGGIGATKVYWFEADGNNNYIKTYSIFLLGTDVLGTTEMYSYDVNADSKDDLVFAFGGSVVILIWNKNGYFDLHYLDWLENWNFEIHSATIYDVFNSGKPDLIVGLTDYYVSTPRIRSYLYTNNFLTRIIPTEKYPQNIILKQNFPNPFNNSTIIRFHLNKSMPVQLIIYDINGKEVIKLIKNQIYNSGEHSVTWTGKNKHGKEVSSGIYLYQVKTKKFLATKKMLLIR